MNEPKTYGLLAEFTTSRRLIEAAQNARDAGYQNMDGFSPVPVHGLSEALGQPYTRLPWAVFTCGLLGGAGAYALQYWTSAIDYPLNIGGRPLHSWPSFIPVTFEVTVLLAAFAAVFGLFFACRLPRPHHALFNAEGFERATEDRFFLCIEAKDPQFDTETTRVFLESLRPDRVQEVHY